VRIERPQAIRLIGLSVSGLEQAGAPRQLPLFGRADRAEEVARVADALRARFGPDAVRRASLAGERPGRQGTGRVGDRRGGLPL